MFGHTFYHKTLRKNIILFGTLFNETIISRVDSEGNELMQVKVPITYGPKNKAMQRLDSDPNLNRPFEITIPLMSFEMTSMSYAPDRKLNTVRKHVVVSDATNTNKQDFLYNPVPYDIDFNLYIMVKNAEDGTRILEQILPFFAPEWTTSVNLIAEMNTKLDIPVIIQSVTCDDTYEGDVSERRTIVWTLGFKMKSYLFGPVYKSNTIKLATTNFFANSIPTPTFTNVEITPGLLANGAPTTNAALTIDKSLIAANNDWDYIVQKSVVNNE